MATSLSAQLASTINQLAGAQESPLNAVLQQMGGLLHAAQQRIQLMQQFFDEHALREKARWRANDNARLARIRSLPEYEQAFVGQPLISIIIPTYSRAQVMIERTIPSILAQDYANWELLIVGDHMAEAQAQVLRQAMAMDPRIHFHNLKFRGRYPTTKAPMWYVAGGKPVNFARRFARGSWLAHLCDDDEFLPHHLSTLLRTAQEARVEWVHGRVRFLDDQGAEQCVVGSEVPRHGEISSIGSLFHAGLKTFRNNTGCWKYFCPGDWDMYDRLMQMGVSHRHCPTVTAVHHGDYFRAEVLDAPAVPAGEPATQAPGEHYRQWLAPIEAAARQLPRPSALASFGVLVIDPAGDAAAVERTLDSLRRQQVAASQIVVLSELTHGEVPSVPLQGDGMAQLGELALASEAEWLLPLYAGDTLADHALSVLAQHAATREDVGCLYMDEDSHGTHGLDEPILKPDINLDLLRSYAYIGRTLAFRRDVFLALDGFDPSHGALAHVDFAFRVIERYGLPAVGHLPELLYHAGLPQAQWLASPAVLAASAPVVAAHLQRLGVAHELLPGSLPGINRVRYLHAEQPAVSIIVPTRDQLPMLNGLIDSLLARTSYRNYELLIVDNDSADPAACQYLDGLEKLGSEQIRVLRYPHPFNYSAINNFAAAQARGDYLILLNNDTAVLQEDWIEALLNHAQRPEVGIVGAKLHYPDGRIQHGGVVLGLRGPADHPFIGDAIDAPGYMHRLQVDQNYTAVTAACLMIRKSVYEAVGGLDEQDFKVSYNDVDLCLKVREAGYLTVWTPYARLMHEGNVSQTKVDKTKQEAKIQRFQGEQRAMYRKWLPLLARDPAYNPNLSVTGHGFELDVRRSLDWQPFTTPQRPRLFCLPADLDGCGHYRIRQPFAAMQREGLVEGATSDVHFDPVALERFAPQSIVLQRQINDGQLQAMARYREYSQAFKVYELDDYLLNVPVKSAFYGRVPKDIKQALRRAMGMVDRFVVSTQPLAEQFAGYHEDIRVVQNLLPPTWWQGLKSQRRVGRKPRVGWGGGASHTGDLELIAEVVRELAGEVEWVFFGMCPDKLRPYVHEYHPGVPIEHYPAKLASLNLDLALAPVEENIFNFCKSNLRLLEYGACGFPVVCSDIVCYQGELPVTRVKNRYKDWVDAIRMHLADLDATAAAGDALREAIHRDWMLEGERLHRWRDAWLPD